MTSLVDASDTPVHPTALIAPTAEIGKDVRIGAFSVIGPKVRLGDGVAIDSHVSVRGRTTIGARTRIWPFASIGTEPQDLKYNGEDTELICGEDNQFREYVNISIGTDGGGGKTTIGDGNLLMVNAHIAHDCHIGNNCIVANGVAVAGHVEVGDHAVLGGLCAIHQFSKIGRLAMLAGGSIVVQDVPPFVTVAGNHAGPKGLNLTGLRRFGIARSKIGDIKHMYKLLFRSELTVDEAVAKMRDDLDTSEYLDEFIDFLSKSERGICR